MSGEHARTPESLPEYAQHTRMPGHEGCAATFGLLTDLAGDHTCDECTVSAAVLTWDCGDVVHVPVRRIPA